jgi:hypothetical protein
VSYFYIAYGVGIYSNSRIEGLECAEPQETPFTVQFETGPEPEWVLSARSSPSRILLQRPEEQTGDSRFVLTEYADGITYELAYSDARFALNGSADRLWASALAPLTPQELSLYFLGPVMGFLLRRKGMTSLHASAVELKNHAVLFSGQGGYGKSTTAAALALRGVPVLADDIVPLELAKNGYWVIPGYPRLCLWPDTVAQLLGDEDSLPRLTPGWEKRYLPLDGTRAKFAAQKKRLGLIYTFGERSSAASAPRIEELGQKEALLALVQNTYMNWLIDREQRAGEFDDLSRMVQQIPVRRVIAHTDGGKLGALRELILQDSEKILRHTQL